VCRNELRTVIEGRFAHTTRSEPAADTTSFIENNYFSNSRK
jgi:hypothetical protein